MMTATFRSNRFISRTVFIIVMLVSGLFLFPEDTGSRTVLRRFALVIGSNNGGKDRSVLRYATKDARSFSDVMMEMGAVAEENLVLLLDPGVEEISARFRTIRNITDGISGGPGRKEFIFYYSGHSDEEGLLLSGHHFTYARLRDEIARIKTDVRLAILDSCSSGAFTRTKGVLRRPPFLIDESSAMKGYAFLTSSSEDEAAQESDNIGASFFTHYLVSGLRGAADSSRDGLVTLNEAYSFSFNETLARTEKTQYGPQHPKYDIQLTGTGDLVLTDLRETSAGLLISNDIAGRLSIRDSSGNLLVELNKSDGYPVELGLKPGDYRIIADNHGELFCCEVSLHEGGITRLSRSGLVKITGEKTTVRGDDNTGGQSVEDKTGGMTITPFIFTFIPLGNGNDPGHAYNVSANLLIGNAPSIIGAQVSSIGNHAAFDVTGFQGAGIYNVTGRSLTGFQGGGIFNIAGEVEAGGQGAGIFNYTTGNLSYFQAGGIFNYVGGTLTGFQAGGITNIAKGEVTGVQIAGLLNLTDAAVNGVQAAGLINCGKDVAGVQVGLINIAHEVDGVQVGLINIAHEYRSGIPIGLVCIGKNGIFNLDFFYDSEGRTHLALRLGSHNVYGLLTASLVPETEPLLWSFGAGFGVHIPSEPFYFDIDLSCHLMNEGPIDRESYGTDHLLPVLRGTAGLVFGRRIGLFAGSKINVLLPGCYNDIDTGVHMDFDLPPFEKPVRLAAEFFGGITFKIF